MRAGGYYSLLTKILLFMTLYEVVEVELSLPIGMVLWVCSELNDIRNMLIGCGSPDRMQAGDRKQAGWRVINIGPITQKT